MFDKILSMLMLPIGLIIIFEELGFMSMNFFMDKVLLGAIFMIIVQISSLIMLNVVHQSAARIINYITFIALIIPAILYMIPGSVSFYEQLPLIIGVMMFVESMYAFH